MKIVSITTPDQLLVHLDELGRVGNKQKVVEFIEMQELASLAKVTDNLLNSRNFRSKFQTDQKFAENFVYYISTLLLFLQKSVKDEPKVWFGNSFFNTMNSLLSEFETTSRYGPLSS